MKGKRNGFSSYEFVLIFLPIVLVVYYLLARLSNTVYQKLFLLGASLFFYGYYHVGYLILILASMLVNYLIAVFIQRQPEEKVKLRIVLLTLGVLFNVGLIGY